MPTCDLCGTECVHTSEGWFSCPECDMIVYIDCPECKGTGRGYNVAEGADALCRKCDGSCVVKPE